MDLTRVGIYGGSAGGQSALAGLLHHGDFYKVGVADCGCHDNRMDKIWWNEAWMGWPVDESYADNSNVTHADKLTGKLMLIVGELDSNVDPASTIRWWPPSKRPATSLTSCRSSTPTTARRKPPTANTAARSSSSGTSGREHAFRMSC